MGLGMMVRREGGSDWIKREKNAAFFVPSLSSKSPSSVDLPPPCVPMAHCLLICRSFVGGWGGDHLFVRRTIPAGEEGMKTVEEGRGGKTKTMEEDESPSDEGKGGRRHLS